jgi:hypothetical protein
MKLSNKVTGWLQGRISSKVENRAFFSFKPPIVTVIK